ncbi:hypothetical protein [Capnocytophaga sp.]|uniref:hypothetical protein n=1 Tax=Capnocytophaga sp. TaxID=44737 RepID=UPI0026DC4780|nr:hypothetical protein [Capnocytophaga sp.]MDO5105928.1 hypothetical protein [Capnocytophaga sp.]
MEFQSDKIWLCEVTFFGNQRKTLPDLSLGTYRPHLVVKGETEYLGVRFIEGEVTEFDKPVLCTIAVLYDTVDYSKMIEDTPFFIMEGAKAVGEGVIKLLENK